MCEDVDLNNLYSGWSSCAFSLTKCAGELTILTGDAVRATCMIYKQFNIHSLIYNCGAVLLVNLRRIRQSEN